MIKHWKEIKKTKSYSLQFIDSARFMASSFSNHVNNFDEGIQKIKFKYGPNDRKCEACGINCKDSYCCLEYINVKDLLIEYNKNYQKNNWWKVKETIFYYIQTLHLWYQ